MKCSCKTHKHIHDDVVLEFTNVNFSYYKNLPILSDVSLQIKDKTNTCIIGPNGGGKSTLLKLILGLLEPADGKVVVFGKKPHKACTHIGYVPQYTEIRPDFPVTLYDVVMMGGVNMHFLGWHKRSCRDYCLEILETLGILHLEKHPFARLSGGQRQRALIARALIGRPQLLLLDEPMANVDPTLEQQFRKLIKDLSSQIAVVTVSHDLDFISDSMDQIIFINRTVNSYQPSEINSDLVWKLFRNYQQNKEQVDV